MHRSIADFLGRACNHSKLANGGSDLSECTPQTLRRRGRAADDSSQAGDPRGYLQDAMASPRVGYTSMALSNPVSSKIRSTSPCSP